MTATDPEAREAMRARIVEMLLSGMDAHEFDPDEYVPGVGRTQLCSCGWNSNGQHRPHLVAHLADVLLGLWDGDGS